MKKITKKLSEYNSLVKENEELYRDAAKTFGMSDGAFWILYTLREHEDGATQSEICGSMYQPKQTVNSALKKMEREGYITLTQLRDRRSKKICLTEKGEKLAQLTVDEVIGAENSALSGLTEEERNQFFGTMSKFTALLREEMLKVKGKQEGNR